MSGIMLEAQSFRRALDDAGLESPTSEGPRGVPATAACTR
jgi:hypothetical protein